MRLLVVTQYFWPETFRINDLVAELAARGHRVTVLTGIPNYPEGVANADYLADPARFASYGGAEIVRVPMLLRGKAGRTRVALAANYASYALSASIIGAWRLRRRAFDAVLVCQLSPVTVGIPGFVMRRLKKAPMALWVLDLWPESLSAVGAVRSRFALWAVERLVRAIYRRCDLILAQSRRFLPEIRRRVADPARVAYFPSWAEEAADPRSVAPAPEVPPAPGTFTVMFTGNIGEAQDFGAILAAADRLRGEPIRWLVVGDGRRAAWVREEIARRDLAAQVLMLGRHPLARMPSFYACADALLVALKPEPIFAMTIPGKLQSYLAAGLPVLAMLDGEGADIVRDSGAGLAVRAGDAAALADAALALARTPAAERAAMGAAGRAFSDRAFSRPKLIGQLETWLEDLRVGRLPGLA